MLPENIRALIPLLVRGVSRRALSPAQFPYGAIELSSKVRDVDPSIRQTNSGTHFLGTVLPNHPNQDRPAYGRALCARALTSRLPETLVTSLQRPYNSLGIVAPLGYPWLADIDSTRNGMYVIHWMLTARHRRESFGQAFPLLQKGIKPVDNFFHIPQF